MERIETWPSLKRPSFIQFYPNIKIVKITKNISPRYHRIFIYVKPTDENCLSDLFFFLIFIFKSKVEIIFTYLLFSRLTMIHRTTEYTVLTNRSISLSPILWSYTYFIIVSRRIYCALTRTFFKNTRVSMYVCTCIYIYIWIYEYFYANARMFASLFRVKKKNSLSRGKLTQVRARRGRFLGRLSERRLCSHGFFRVSTSVRSLNRRDNTCVCNSRPLPLCIPVEHSFASQ